MSSAPRLKLTTFDDFCTLLKDGEKGDLIDGVIYMASPDNTDANSIASWLYSIMDRFVEEEDLGGEFYISRVAFRLDDTNGPEPDVAYVAQSRLHLVKRGFVNGPPDLAVEVVSPDSVERDYQKKRKQYQQAGVKEYWIVDEIKQTITLLQLGRNRRYLQARPVKGKLHSKVLKGFWIRPEWLWAIPRPKKAATVSEIRATQ